jgi:hypothetical protein
MTTMVSVSQEPMKVVVRASDDIALFKSILSDVIGVVCRNGTQR